MIGGSKVLNVKDTKKKIVDCLREFGESVIVERADDSEMDLIEIDFEPVNPNASSGSIQIYGVRSRRPWLRLSAGIGLRFEWYDGCDYPDVCHFIHAIASGNVHETVSRWHEHWIGSTGYIEINGKRYETSYNVLGLHYFLAKVTQKSTETEMQYEAWN